MQGQRYYLHHGRKREKYTFDDKKGLGELVKKCKEEYQIELKDLEGKNMITKEKGIF